MISALCHISKSHLLHFDGSKSGRWIKIYLRVYLCHAIMMYVAYQKIEE